MCKKPLHRITAVMTAVLFPMLGLTTVSAQGTPTGKAIISSDFETGTTDPWVVRGTTEKIAAVNEEAHSGKYSLKVSGRTTTWQGPLQHIPVKLAAGDRYHIAGWLKYSTGPSNNSFNLSVERGFTDPATAHQYQNLATVTVQTGQWTLIEADYTIPNDATLKTLDFYFETRYKTDNQVSADDTVDFYIDDVAVTKQEIVLNIQQDIPSLRDSLTQYFDIGVAVDPDEVDSTNPHFRLLTKHFAAIVAGNAMKPESLQPKEGQFSWAAADKIVSFAELTGMRVRGHTLVWHNQTPDWFFTDPKDSTKPASRDLLLARLKNHIQTVVGHFKGSVESWDVVNEVLSDSSSGLRSQAEGSRWMGILGADYIDKAFQWAHEADPKAVLVINDYNLESSAAKREAMYQLVKGMLARKIPVGAVGLQMHISIYGPTVDEIRTTIERFASLGVKVQVTEMDVSIYTFGNGPKKDPTPEILAQQAQRYHDIFTMFEQEAKKGILNIVMLWGSADDTSWLNNFPVAGRPDAPLLFDRSLQAKPAFWSIVGQQK